MNKKLLIGAGVAFTLLFSPLHQTFAAESKGDVRKVDNVAHRGAAGYAPENTIAAFDKAVEMKADYIEIDVQRSKDGELGKGLPGAGFFALRSTAAVVPCAIIGPYKPFKTLRVVYGKPINMDEYREKKITTEEMTGIIMGEIGKLLKK